MPREMSGSGLTGGCSAGQKERPPRSRPATAFRPMASTPFTRTAEAIFGLARAENLPARQGLFSDEIYEILEDDFGYFWMSCRTGIFRASKKDFDELDRGKIEAVTCVAFGKGDGLASVQCNGVAKPAGWKGKDGQLWFPTIRGVVAVDSRIKTNDQPPPVAIEDIIADKKTFPSPKPEVRAQSVLAATLDLGRAALEIPPGRGELEIHYTALS